MVLQLRSSRPIVDAMVLVAKRASWGKRRFNCTCRMVIDLCGDGIVIKACKAKVHQVARGAKTPKPSDHSASVPSRGPWLSEQRVSGERKTKEDQEEKEELAAEKWTQEDEVRNRLKEYNKNLDDTISTLERLVASSH